MATARLVVMISGYGRNFQAILRATHSAQVPATVAAVISNNPLAGGLAHAREAGVPTFVINHRGYADRAAFEQALTEAIDPLAPDFVVLAGFMRVLGSEFVQRYRGRLLNIHPSLLPKYPGLRTHERVLADGEPWHGASVHFVTEAVDGGPVILQGRIAVKRGDNPEVLAARVLQEVEVVIYPKVLQWACSGRLGLKGEQVMLDGKVLARPLQLDEIGNEVANA